MSHGQDAAEKLFKYLAPTLPVLKLTLEQTYLLINNSGGSRFEFGTSDHFLDTLQPVVGEIFGKV